MKLLIILFITYSCSKPQDYSYLNTDRRPQVILTSQYYPNTPGLILSKVWIPDSVIIYLYPRDVDHRSYIGLPSDTMPKNWKELMGVCPTVQVLTWNIKY